jgi:hypothetical protein
MSVEFGLVSDDYTVMEDYRARANAPAPGGGGEAAPLLQDAMGRATTFTQIEHVSINPPINSQPSLISIDGKPV